MRRNFVYHFTEKTPDGGHRRACLRREASPLGHVPANGHRTGKTAEQLAFIHSCLRFVKEQTAA